MSRQQRQRWYDARGQNRIHVSALEKASGIRKIISLVVLLILVLMLIRQTSDVNKVEKVATAIGLLPSPNSAIAVPIQAVTDPQQLRVGDRIHEGITTLELVALQAADLEVQNYQSIWKALLKKGTEPVVALISHKLFGDSKPSVTQDDSAASSWAPVVEWSVKSKSQLEKWLEIENRNFKAGGSTKDFSELFQNNESWFASPVFDPSALTKSSSSEFFRGLRLAIDERLLEQIVDNATFWTTDRLPFARCWQRVDTLRELLANKLVSHDHFNKLEVSQLMGEGLAHRGAPVQFDGSIFLVGSAVSFSETGFETQSYHPVWLKPDGINHQPVCVYVPIANIDPSIKLEKGSSVTATGYFFKRIAYASQRGPEIAPLLLAAYLKPIDSADKTVRVANPFEPWASLLAKEKRWQPPVDTATPYSLVSMNLKQVLEMIGSEEVRGGFQEAKESVVMPPLHMLERFAPEIEFLLSNQTDWPITENSTLSRISGVVTKIERVAMESQLSSIQGIPHLYRCQIKCLDHSLELACNKVPSGWLNVDGTPIVSIQQPCVVDALKTTQKDGSIFAWATLPRWKWVGHPDLMGSLQYEPDVPVAQRFLLENGWDLNWLDVIREMQSAQIKPLSSRELAPLYSLMQIARQSPYELYSTKNNSLEAPRSIPQLIETLRQKKQGGTPGLERVQMAMRVVRVSSVNVVNANEAAMLGSDRYYQLDAMADIGDRTYEIKEGENSVVYHKEYPVTCVLVKLPDWLINTESGSSVDLLAGKEQVWYPRVKSTASGWFYRFWSYKTQETSESLGGNRKQVGPLIVLDQITLGFAEKPNSQFVVERVANYFVLFLGVLGTIGIWWFVRRSTLRS